MNHLHYRNGFDDTYKLGSELHFKIHNLHEMSLIIFQCESKYQLELRKITQFN